MIFLPFAPETFGLYGEGQNLERLNVGSIFWNFEIARIFELIFLFKFKIYVAEKKWIMSNIVNSEYLKK